MKKILIILIVFLANTTLVFPNIVLNSKINFNDSIKTKSTKIIYNKFWLTLGVNSGIMYYKQDYEIFNRPSNGDQVNDFKLTLGFNLDINYCYRSPYFHKIKMARTFVFGVNTSNIYANTISYMRGYFLSSLSAVDFSFGLGVVYGNKISSKTYNYHSGGYSSFPSTTIDFKYKSFATIGIPFEIKYTSNKFNSFLNGISIEGNINKELPCIGLRLLYQIGNTSNISTNNNIDSAKSE